MSLDREMKKVLADYFESGDLVDFLDIDVEDVIDIFEEDIEESMDDIEELIGYRRGEEETVPDWESEK